MSDWNDLEKYVKHITAQDNTTRTPLSGATKQEEDVVGQSIICQCKNTVDKNFSIHMKDIDRLINATTLQDKFPLFFSRNKSCTLASIPIIDDEHEEMTTLVINYIILRKRLKILSKVKATEPKTFIAVEKEFNKLKRLFANIGDECLIQFDAIEKKIDTQRNNMLMYNLFEENLNESKTK